MKTTQKKNGTVANLVKPVNFTDHLLTLPEVSDEEDTINQASEIALTQAGYGFVISSARYEVQLAGETIAILMVEQPRDKPATKVRNHLFRNHRRLAVAAAITHQKKQPLVQRSLLENLAPAQPVASKQ